MASLAPIAIFIYARPDHLRHTLTSLRNSPGFAESPVFVFADGPKKPEQAPQVEAARAVAREMLGERATYRFADGNKGLARSIIGGVDELTQSFGRAIVVEDDLGLSPQFLPYMNAALDSYADADHVYQVSGHMFDVPALRNSRRAALLPFTTTWGWGTWRRAWQHFDPASSGWERLQADRAFRHRFNLDGCYDYATMLERQMRARADSWGVRWYWSVFNRQGLAVYPPQTLVDNRGMDGSGSHGRGLFRDYTRAMDSAAAVPEFPEPVLDPGILAAAQAAIYRQNGGALGKVVDKIKKLVR